MLSHSTRSEGTALQSSAAPVQTPRTRSSYSREVPTRLFGTGDFPPERISTSTILTVRIGCLFTFCYYGR